MSLTTSWDSLLASVKPPRTRNFSDYAMNAAVLAFKDDLGKAILKGIVELRGGVARYITIMEKSRGRVIINGNDSINMPEERIGYAVVADKYPEIIDTLTSELRDKTDYGIYTSCRLSDNATVITLTFKDSKYWNKLTRQGLAGSGGKID